MKAICIKSNAKGLELNEVKTLFVDKFDYGLIIGREYLIMAIALYKDSNCLYYLLDNDGNPNWYPYMLFEISDHRLPLDWHVTVLGMKSRGDLHTLMGFKELCNDPDFYDLLIERNRTALQTYFMRKEKTEICTWDV